MLPLLFEHIRRIDLYLGIPVQLGDTWRGEADQNNAKKGGFSGASWGQSYHNVTYRSGKSASLAYHIEILLPPGQIMGYGHAKMRPPGIPLVTLEERKVGVGELLYWTIGQIGRAHV